MTVLSFLMTIVLSKIGMVGIVGGLVAAAVAAAVLNFPRWVSIALIAAAGIHLYSGWIYQDGRAAGYAKGYAVGETEGTARGKRACELKVAAEVAAEQERQRLINESNLATSEARADQLEAEVAARQKEIAEYAKELAEIAAREPPPKPGCKPVSGSFTARDIERLQHLLLGPRR